MKSTATILLCLIMYIGLGTGLNAQRSGENAAERERKKLSVILLVQGTVKTAENQPIDTQSIYDEINGNKRQHQEKERSSLLSRAHIEKEFEDGLQNRLDEIFITAGLKDADPAWCKKTEAEALVQGRVLIKNNLSENFSDAFHQTRSTVVKEQEAKLLKFATPETHQDYLNVEKKSPALHDDLMVRSINMYSEPLFSENQDFLSRKINDIIDEAWRQFDEQRRMVRESQGGGESDITVDSIQEAIQSDIERYRASLKSAFNIFPSVQESILPKSRQLSSEKFDRWVASWSYIVPQEKIRREIAADSVTHRIGHQSRQVLLQFFRPEIREKLLSDYLGRLSPNEQQHLRKFLESQPSFDTKIDLSVDKSLKYFDDAREGVSRAQFARFFPDLTDSSWKLDDNAVQERHNQDKEKDNQKIAQNFLAGKQVIAETDDLVEEAVRRLAARGDAAIEHQMSLAADYSKRAKRNTLQLFLRVADNEMGAEQFINDLVREATAEIQQTWSGIALSSEYAQLFDLVKAQIRKDIKDLIPIELNRRKEIREEEIRKAEAKRLEEHRLAQLQQEADRKIKEDEAKKRKKEKEGGTLAGGGGKGKGPGEGPGEGPGKGSGKGDGGGGGKGPGDGGGAKKEKISPDVIIDIDIENEKIVKVVVDIKATDPFTFTFQLGNENYNIYHARVTPYLETVEKRFKDYFNRGAEDAEIEYIYIFTRVFNVRVPYGIVYDLRESLRKVVNDRDGKKLPILWYDGFFLKREDTISEDIRKRSSSLETAK